VSGASKLERAVVLRSTQRLTTNASRSVWVCLGGVVARLLARANACATDDTLCERRQDQVDALRSPDSQFLEQVDCCPRSPVIPSTWWEEEDRNRLCRPHSASIPSFEKWSDTAKFTAILQLPGMVGSSILRQVDGVHAKDRIMVRLPVGLFWIFLPVSPDLQSR